VIPFPPAQTSYAATETPLSTRCSAPFSVAAGFIPTIRDPVPTGAGKLRRYGNPVIHALLGTFFCSGGVYPRRPSARFLAILVSRHLGGLSECNERARGKAHSLRPHAGMYFSAARSSFRHAAAFGSYFRRRAQNCGEWLGWIEWQSSCRKT